MTLSAPMAPLGRFQRWINWSAGKDLHRPDKLKKIPRNPRTGAPCAANDPLAWCSYEEALTAAQQRGHGVGFCFTQGDGLFFLDMDNCLDQATGQWSPIAQHLMAVWGGHAAIEVSQSGRGLHIFGWASSIPEHGCKNIPLGLELYHTDRFVAFTDRQSVGQIGTADLSAPLAGVIQAYFQRTAASRNVVDWTDTGAPHADGAHADDGELLRIMLRSGKKSAAAMFNAENHVTFEDLWTANAEKLSRKWPSQNGYDSFDRSNADSALASLLVFWTAGNCERVERLMRQSALLREKWDEREDYLERTILRACSTVKDRAEPRDMGKVPTIAIVPGELHRAATEGENALIAAGIHIYQREGLVRPVIGEVAASGGYKTKVARLVPVTVPLMLDYLSRFAHFQKFDARKQMAVRAHPPEPVAKMILAREGEWSFPHLIGVITAPTLRPDGSLFATPGYDQATRLLLMSPPEMPVIPEAPSQSDALTALAKLGRLLKDFPFADAASRSVAYSALISAVVRGALPVVPLHAITAPTSGSGKSFLVDLVAAILMGDRAPVLSAAEKVEETEKRLTGALLDGSPIIALDNVNADLYSDLLAQAVERPLISVRPLGTSVMRKIESRATIFATGNNLRLVSDMARRTVVCSLDPEMERPELRKFDANPFADALAHRGEFLAAALTIVRAYVAAGMPDKLSALNSFEAWSDMVRSALVWLGQADPVETQERARAVDPSINQLGAILSALHGAVGTAHLLTKVIIETANVANASGIGHKNENLRDALLAIASDNHNAINAQRLGTFLGRHEGRIVGGYRLERQMDGKTQQPKWASILLDKGGGSGG